MHVYTLQYDKLLPPLYTYRWAVILAFDVKVEREAQEMADGLGVRIFTADIIYHLFDSFLKHRQVSFVAQERVFYLSFSLIKPGNFISCIQEYRDSKRKEFGNIAVFPCKLRILPDCIFNTRDPIVVGVVIESGVLKAGTPLTVPSKNVSTNI